MSFKNRLVLFFAGILVSATPVFAMETFTGDWGGTRAQWAEAGVDLEMSYTADYFQVVSGGLRREGEYLGNLDLTASFDGAKLFSIPGARFFLYIIADHGHNQNGGPSRHVGDFQGVSNIDALIPSRSMRPGMSSVLQRMPPLCVLVYMI